MWLMEWRNFTSRQVCACASHIVSSKTPNCVWGRAQYIGLPVHYSGCSALSYFPPPQRCKEAGRKSRQTLQGFCHMASELPWLESPIKNGLCDRKVHRSNNTIMWMIFPRVVQCRGPVEILCFYAAQVSVAVAGCFHCGGSATLLMFNSGRKIITEDTAG